MQKKINIIWIHSHFNYWMGGTKYIYEVISRLNKKYNIYILVEDYAEFSKKQYEKINLKINKINVSSSYSPIYWILFPLMIAIDYLNVMRFIQKNNLKKHNTIIITSMFPMNFIGTTTQYKNIQLCFEPFAFFYDEEFTKSFSFVKRLFIKMLSTLYSGIDKYSTKKADLVLTLNSITRRLIKKRFSVASILTQAGVNSELFRPYISSRILKKYKGNSIAIHSTDYSPVKGTDKVIKAFALSKKNIKNSKLLITSTIKNEIAKEKLLKQAKKLNIEKDVIFLGFVPIQELPQLYTIANVLVQGSSSINSGTTSMALPVKEAMSCETPAIRPDAGGEDVVNNKTGFLVDPNNTKELAEKMSLLLSSTNLSKKMGKDARKYIVNRYTWNNTAKVFINAIESIK